MTEPYSYREDPDVPVFPDDKPLFVFDGHCVLCSRGASWLMKHGGGRVRFASAQSRLGATLYRHYGIDPDQTYLLVSKGTAAGESSGYLILCELLGGRWRTLTVFRLVPRAVRDWAYGVVARNRYRWFGRVEQCALLTKEQKSQLLS